MELTVINKELKKFNITDLAIKKLGEEYLPLKINGLKDKEGFDKVHTARMDIKSRRVSIGKTAKELKADAIAFQNAVNGEKKRIEALLAPIEAHLSDEEGKITEEKAAIKRRKEEELAQMVQSRVALLTKLGADFDGMNYFLGNAKTTVLAIQGCNEDAFEIISDEFAIEFEKLEAFKIEQAKVTETENARIEAERVAEAERQAKVKAEQEKEAERLKAIADEQAKAQAKIDADQKAIEDAQKAEKLKVEAETQAKIAAEKKLADEAEAKRLAKEEAAREEALKPEKEKVIAFANSLLTLELPAVKDPKLIKIVGNGYELLAKVTHYLVENCK